MKVLPTLGARDRINRSWTHPGHIRRKKLSAVEGCFSVPPSPDANLLVYAESLGMSAMENRYSRRHFMGLSGAGIASLVGGRAISGAAAAPADFELAPDLVVLNAKVFTVDPALPATQAFAVKAGRFMGVGSTEDIRSLIGMRTQVF